MQTHEMENRFFTATQNAWVLGVVSVVVLMHSVFFSKISRGTDINSYDVGCMTTMLAFSALLVQYTTESALGRLCAVGPMDDPQRPDEIQTCELQLVSDNLSADYTFFGNLGAILLALLVSDVPAREAAAHCRVAQHLAAHQVVCAGAAACRVCARPVRRVRLDTLRRARVHDAVASLVPLRGGAHACVFVHAAGVDGPEPPGAAHSRARKGRRARRAVRSRGRGAQAGGRAGRA